MVDCLAARLAVRVDQFSPNGIPAKARSFVDLEKVNGVSREPALQRGIGSEARDVPDRPSASTTSGLTNSRLKCSGERPTSKATSDIEYSFSGRPSCILPDRC